MGDDDKPVVVAPVDVNDLDDRQLMMATHTVVIRLEKRVGAELQKIRDHIEPDRYENSDAPPGLREVDRDHEERIVSLEKYKKKSGKHEAAETEKANAKDLLSSLSTEHKIVGAAVFCAVFLAGGGSVKAALKLLELFN